MKRVKTRYDRAISSSSSNASKSGSYNETKCSTHTRTHAAAQSKAAMMRCYIASMATSIGSISRVSCFKIRRRFFTNGKDRPGSTYAPQEMPQFKTENGA